MRARTSSAVALTSRPGRDPLQQPQDHPEVLHVGPDRLGDARVLDLDRDLAAVVQAARGRPGRSRRRRSASRRTPRTPRRASRPSSDSIDLAHVGEAHLRRRVAQLAELALELLAVLLGHEADVEERHHLPELHRRALHRPQRGDDLLGRLEVAALERLLLALVVARQVAVARAELARGLARREAARPEPCARAVRSGSGPWPCPEATGSARGVAAPAGASPALGAAPGVARRRTGSRSGWRRGGRRARRRRRRGVLVGVARLPSASGSRSASAWRLRLPPKNVVRWVPPRSSRRRSARPPSPRSAAIAEGQQAGDQRDARRAAREERAALGLAQAERVVRAAPDRPRAAPPRVVDLEVAARRRLARPRCPAASVRQTPTRRRASRPGCLEAPRR